MSTPTALWCLEISSKRGLPTSPSPTTTTVSNLFIKVTLRIIWKGRSLAARDDLAQPYHLFTTMKLYQLRRDLPLHASQARPSVTPKQQESADKIRLFSDLKARPKKLP